MRRNKLFEEEVLTTNVDVKENEEQSSAIVIGNLVGFNFSNIPLVDFVGNPFSEALRAVTVVVLNRSDIGKKIVLMFENADLKKPIIMGIVQPERDITFDVADKASNDSQEPLVIEKDNERVVITAKKEIVLKCGRGCITITKAGKIIIRGSYLLNQSSGVNRIKGGSVQIN